MEITPTIKRLIKMHSDLHGRGNIEVEPIVKDFMRSQIVVHPYIEVDVRDITEREISIYNMLPTKIERKFGLMLGRFQPFHFGHQNIVNEILLDGLIPVIVIGSINADRDKDKNPLSFDERAELIRTIYPNNEVIIVGVNDHNSWDSWMEDIKSSIWDEGCTKKDTTLYFHNKEVDRHKRFTFDGNEFTDEFYTKIFEVEGFKMKPIEFVDRTDFKIQADGRDIRHNIEGFKHFLDGRIYNKLKEIGW